MRMKFRTSIFGLTACFVLLLWATAVWAAPTAQTLLNKGNKLFAEGNYASSYEVFREGYELSPSPVFLRSMAYSLLKMFQHDKARGLLQDYLKKYPDAKDKKSIADIINSLEVVVQTKVTINSDPPGAELFFDTEATGKIGTTPYQGTIEPGTHTIILRKDGYHTTVQNFEILAKQNYSVNIALELPLSVTSAPPGAAVYIDKPEKHSFGQTPLTIGVSPGTHTVYVKLPGYKTYSQSIQVNPGGGGVTVNARLGLGISINSTPPGAKVEIDGQPLEGVTPLEVDAVTGRHTVTLTLEGFKPASEEVTIGPGLPNKIEARLVGGLLTLQTEPTGAEVSIGRIELGSTPLENTPVPLGEQVLKVKHPERRPYTQAFNFTEGEAINAKVQMGRQMWPVWTMAGVSAAGLAFGIITGLIAKNKVDNPENVCTDEGKPVKGTCSYTYHWLSNIGFGTAILAGAGAFSYYWFYARPTEEINRTPVQQSFWQNLLRGRISF